ncbi:MAG: hypothetical protein ACJAVI_004666 [Candidatus Azotimanducaceae bacterium]|jgi:hypothetical protein
MKLEFYEILSKDDAFCKALGQVMLAASKLEIELKQYLRLQGSEIPEKKVTLGNLIGILERNDHLTRNGEIHLKSINAQRNYLIHNLYGSFVGEIEAQMLPVNDLVHEDVEVYTEKTKLTAYNFGVYSRIVCKAIEQHNRVAEGL